MLLMSVIDVSTSTLNWKHRDARSYQVFLEITYALTNPALQLYTDSKSALRFFTSEGFGTSNNIASSYTCKLQQTTSCT